MTETRRRQINAQLHRLAELHDGRLVPDMVIEDARDPSSPLHGEFEWDDARAAHAHRVSTALKLINGFRVNVSIEERTLNAPAYVRSVQRPVEYTAIDRVAAERDLAQATLQREAKRVLAALDRMRAIAVALGMGERVELMDRAARDVLRASEGTAGEERSGRAGQGL